LSVTETAATVGGGGGGGGLAVTVTSSVPVTPSLDAEMTADPALMPVIAPLAETLAIVGLELENSTVRLLVGIVFPDASRSVTDGSIACPIARLVSGAATVTDATAATGGGIEMVVSITVSPMPRTTVSTLA
jgi:hypothetical protein